MSHRTVSPMYAERPRSRARTQRFDLDHILLEHVAPPFRHGHTPVETSVPPGYDAHMLRPNRRLGRGELVVDAQGVALVRVVAGVASG